MYVLILGFPDNEKEALFGKQRGNVITHGIRSFCLEKKHNSLKIDKLKLSVAKFLFLS